MGAMKNACAGLVMGLMASLLASAGYPVLAAELTQAANFNIPAQQLSAALLKYSEQSGIQVTTASELLEGKATSGVVGKLSVRAALTRLLQGTDLEFNVIDASTVTIRLAAPPTVTSGTNGHDDDTATRSADVGKRIQLAQTQSEVLNQEPPSDEETDAPPEREESVTRQGIPEVLVTGSKILNMDIRRTRDDVLPYVVFDRKVIEQSGAHNLEDFFRRRLTMNTNLESFSQNQGVEGNRSLVNLRGLGETQTLLLINGRRTSSTNFAGDRMAQQDLNGIPLGAVERIEILPTTASGIYGGEATGGVVNIILRRDYEGAELKVTYDNTFDTDSTRRLVDFNAGFNLEDGKTNVMVSASWSDQNGLTRGDRDFVQKYRDESFALRSAVFLPPNVAPVGATPNIRSLSGNLQLDPQYGGTNLNAEYTHVPVGYTGIASDNAAALVTNAGTYNLALSNSAQPQGDLQSNGGNNVAMINTPTVESMSAIVRRQFSERVHTFLEGVVSNNTGQFITNGASTYIYLPPDAPGNPFEQDIEVSIPHPNGDGEVFTESKDRRVAGGVIVSLPAQWQAAVDYTWSRTGVRFKEAAVTDATLNDAFVSGELEALRDVNVFPLDYSPYMVAPFTGGPFQTTSRNSTLLLGGPVAELPAGELLLNFKVEHRNEVFSEALQTRAFTTSTGTIGTEFIPERSQSVTSAYLEARVPLVSAKNALPLVRELELQVSGRYDDYALDGATSKVFSGAWEEFFGPPAPVVRVERDLHSSNPTAGLSWKPIDDLTFRASYGKGFLPPNVNQMITDTFIGTDPSTLIDPLRGSQPIGAPIVTLAGGNLDLGPEESEGISAGLILTPRFLPGLRLSVDYTNLKKTDNITSLSDQLIVDNESSLPGRVTRGANLPGDPAGWAGPITVVDSSLVNIAEAKVEAFDLQLDYHLETARFGAFDFFALATRQTHYETQVAPTTPVLENVGHHGGPLEFKANAGLNWTRAGLTLGWNTTYYDSYLVYSPTFRASNRELFSLLQGNGGKVDSQIYHDMFATYAFDALPGIGTSGWRSGLLSGTTIRLGIRNVFNTEPPRHVYFTNNYSTYGDPRLASYYISVMKSFGP